MPLKRVTKWLNKFEKYFFYYKDGFFVLPYLTNTPELMIDSLRGMPFVSQDSQKNILYSNNPFTTGELHYEAIEEGLWLMVAKQEFKANVHTKAVYDEKPSDYFFLAFSIYENKAKPDLDMMINRQKVKNNSWAIYRPGVAIDAFHTKGTKGLFFNFAFNKKWVEDNFLEKGLPQSSVLQKILDAEMGYLSWEGLLTVAQATAMDIWNSLSIDSDAVFSKLKLKINTLEILKMFFEKIQPTIDLSPEPRPQKGIGDIQKIEQVLLESITQGFPGIEFLSEKINMSPSKLKVNFKKTHGTSIFQYYRNTQMNLAKEMLKDADIQVKNVAVYFGYENPSKFSVAFRKVHNMLPSEVAKK